MASKIEEETATITTLRAQLAEAKKANDRIHLVMTSRGNDIREQFERMERQRKHLGELEKKLAEAQTQRNQAAAAYIKQGLELAEAKERLKASLARERALQSACDTANQSRGEWFDKTTEANERHGDEARRHVITFRELSTEKATTERLAAQLAKTDHAASNSQTMTQPSDAQLKAAICCGDGECPLKEWAATNNRSLDCETDQFDCRVKAVRALYAPIGTTPEKEQLQAVERVLNVKGLDALHGQTPAAKILYLLSKLTRRDEALLACETVFREYARLHLAKTPPDEEKAIKNAGMAEVCNCALRDIGRASVI